jgi:AraC-like DNA-binding protein
METNNSQSDFSNNLSEPFQSLIENPDAVFQLLDMFPMPIEIFAPDGTAVFINRALLEMHNLTDTSLLVGKYNLLNDPVCNSIPGFEEAIQKGFRGEFSAWSDFFLPVQNLVDRGIVEEKPFEMAFSDVSLTPIFNGEILTYVVCVFVVKRMYKGRPDVARAKEYIDSHWLYEFDPNTVAKSLNISPKHLAVVFKQHTGMTLHDYYNKVKVDHIKEKLKDKNLLIAEAFSLCGEDNRGAFVRTFKELTGMTPSEYRNS